jgi:hypothetical protein
LLSSHEQELSVDHTIDIRKQSALEEAEEPEPQPEPEDRTMTVSRFNEGVGITEAGFRCLRTSVRTSSEQQHEIRRMLASYEILKEKISSLSRQASVLDIFKSPSGTRSSPAVLLDTEDDDPHDPLQLKRDYLLHELSFLTYFL